MKSYALAALLVAPYSACGAQHNQSYDNKEYMATYQRLCDDAISAVTLLNTGAPATEQPALVSSSTIAAASAASITGAWGLHQLCQPDALPKVTRTLMHQKKFAPILLLPLLKPLVTPTLAVGIGAVVWWKIKNSILETAELRHKRELETYKQQAVTMQRTMTALLEKHMSDTNARVKHVETVAKTSLDNIHACQKDLETSIKEVSVASKAAGEKLRETLLKLGQHSAMLQKFSATNEGELKIFDQLVHNLEALKKHQERLAAEQERMRKDLANKKDKKRGFFS